jgi:hypothetical protein
MLAAPRTRGRKTKESVFSSVAAESVGIRTTYWNAQGILRGTILALFRREFGERAFVVATLFHCPKAAETADPMGRRKGAGRHRKRHCDGLKPVRVRGPKPL